MTSLTVSIIISNRNGRARLEEFLNDLFAQARPPERVILVDNDSADDSVAFVRERYPQVEIWSAHKPEEVGATSTEIQQAVAADPATLQAAARRDVFDSEALSRLSAAAVLQEKPFVSEVPLLGPLIARFRTAWNNIASRWYVEHYVTQQNEFNRLAVEQIERYEAELDEMLALLEEQVAITAEARQRVQKLQARLATLDLPPLSGR